MNTLEILEAARAGNMARLADQEGTDPWELQQAVRDLEKLGAVTIADSREMGSMTSITPIGEQMMGFMRCGKRLDERYARVLVEAAHPAVNCLREAAIAIAVFCCGQSIFKRPGERETTSLTRFRKPDDRSDVECIIRAYLALVEEQRQNGPGAARTMANRLGLNANAFNIANGLHQKILDEIRCRRDWQLNETPAGYDLLAWSFLTGFAEWLLYHDRPVVGDWLWFSLPGNRVKLVDESKFSSMPEPVLLPVCFIPVEGKHGRKLLLATSAMSVDNNMLERHFKQRMEIKLWSHRWHSAYSSCSPDEQSCCPTVVYCLEDWRIDSRSIANRLIPAPADKQTRQFMVDYAYERAINNPQAFQIRKRLQMANLKLGDAAEKLPAVSADEIKRAIMEQLSGSESVDEINGIQITLGTLERVTGIANLEAHVQEVETRFPDIWEVNGCNLELKYHPSGQISVTVNLSKGHAPALKDLTAESFPLHWRSRVQSISVIKDGAYSAIKSDGCEQQQLDELRRRAAVWTLQLEYPSLPENADKLVVELTVEHPQGRRETLYLCAAPGYQACSQRDVSVADAQKHVTNWLMATTTRTASEVLAMTNNGSEDITTLVRDLVELQMTQLTSQLENVLSPAALALARDALAQAVSTRLGEELKPRSERRAALLSRLRLLRAMALEQSKPEAGDKLDGLINSLYPKQPESFAPSPVVLNLAEEGLKDGELAQLGTPAQADHLRLELRYQLFCLRRQATESCVRGSVKKGVEKALKPLQEMLQAGNLQAVQAALPSARQVVAQACANPKPQPQVKELRGGLSRRRQ